MKQRYNMAGYSKINMHWKADRLSAEV